MAGLKTLLGRAIILILHVLDRILSTFNIRLVPVTLDNILWRLPAEVQNEARDPLTTEPLSYLLRDIEKDKGLGLVNRINIILGIRGYLTNNASIRKLIQEDPRIVDVPIVKPVIITGLARAGTTLLHRLMSMDPQLRGLLSWEVFVPRSPELQHLTEEESRHERRQRNVADFEMQDILGFGPSQIQVAHELDVDCVDEEVPLMENAFLLFWHAVCGSSLESLRQWFFNLEGQDLKERYEWVKKQMQLIIYKDPVVNPTLLLKTTVHSVTLDGLLSVYPDARLIFCHRKLTEVAPSLCSVLRRFMEPIFGCKDDNFVSRCLQFAIVSCTNMVKYFKAQEQLPPEERRPYYNMYYPHLIQDPIGEVKKIYDHFGLDLSSEAEMNMRKYMAANPKHKFGQHRYSLEEWGIKQEDIRAQVQEYLEYFKLHEKDWDLF